MKVSFILVAYNQEEYIREAVASALRQDYDDIEFIFSDDHSADRTFKIMQNTAAEYPTKNIKLNLMRRNSGLAQHINYCLSQATGEIIVFAAGDDISLENRVSRSVDAFIKNPTTFAVSFRDREIDQNGNLLNFRFDAKMSGFYDLRRGLKSRSSLFLGASRAVRRECFDRFGPLYADLSTEDTPFLLRSLMLGGITILESQGIFYRRSSGALSSPERMKFHTSKRLTEQFKADCSIAKVHSLISNKDSRLIHEWILYKALEKDSLNERTANFYFRLMLGMVKNRYLRAKIFGGKNAF